MQKRAVRLPCLGGDNVRPGRSVVSVFNGLLDIPSRQDMSSTTASQEELKAHRVPLAWRDQCSAYVINFYSHARAVSLTRYMLAKPTRIIFHLLLGIVLTARMDPSVLCV